MAGYEGLTVGLEIHQQLSGKKLFCNCPAELVEGEADLRVRRTLRASAGETGEVDIAAASEQSKQKAFVYEAYESGTCLVELDEEPPHPVNGDALETTVMVAKAFGSRILPKTQFMRKTIIDGSNVSGFQRTGLVALGGKVPGHDVGIQIVSLEEDAAKIVERNPSEDIYNLTRLGIPLIEIATAPDIHDPNQAKEVAQTIGMVLRSTGRVKRGLGTIRQDLNVSIKGGTRIEIKGAQDLRMIPTLIRNEAQRQHGLIELKNDLPGKLSITDPMDVSKIFAKSEKGFIKAALKSGSALGICLAGFGGLLGRELCPSYRLGSELADLAKSKGFGGIIHGDEDFSKYGVDREEVAQYLGCEEEDSFIVCLGEPEALKDLLCLVIIPRIERLHEGVPKEVRKANANGTTSFLRPIGTGARYYPETDVPIVDVPLDVKAPRLLSEQIGELSQETGLSKDLARKMVLEEIPIQSYKERYPELDYGFLSSALVEWPLEIESKKGIALSDVALLIEPLFEEISSGKLARSSVKSVLEDAAEEMRAGNDPNVKKIAGKYEQMPSEELESIIDKVMEENPDATTGALMGVVMREVRGRADGNVVMELLKKRGG